MSRKKRRKPKGKPDRTQRANHLKALALTKVAKQAWAANQRYKAVALLTEAVQREPDNPEILVELATACGKQRDYERAEKLLARLMELAPRSASIYHTVAVAYSIIDRPERAAECLRRSLELNRDAKTTVDTLLDLANLYERSHQLDESREAVAEALQRDPENQSGQLLRATLDRRQGDKAGAESRLRDM